MARKMIYRILLNIGFIFVNEPIYKFDNGYYYFYSLNL